MNKLLAEIKKIPKECFSLNDVRKISSLKAPSLKVALNRLVRHGELIKIGGRFYCLYPEKVNWEKIAGQIYQPSYLSFESALAYYNILSQQPYHLTFATAKRTKQVQLLDKEVFYHHIKLELFWGYQNDSGVLIAEPEKALIDLAYLSLNGYARFDEEEVDFESVDVVKLERYLKKIKNKRLEKVFDNILKK